MEYSGCKSANPNHIRILQVIDSEPKESNNFSDILPDTEISNNDTLKPVILDLGKSAIYLMNSDDKRDPLVARVIVKTRDNKLMVSKDSDPRFNEAIVKEVEVSSGKQVISLPVEVNGSVIESLNDIGVEKSEIESVSLELFEEPNNSDFYIANVGTTLTEKEISDRLDNEEVSTSDLSASDFIFKKEPKVVVPRPPNNELDDEDIFSKLALNISRYIKKICNIN